MSESARIYGVSTKRDGTMSYAWGTQEEVARNRAAFLSTLKLTEADCVYIEVEHSDRIVQVDRAHAGTIIPCDALITQAKGIALFLLTADCLPVAIHDPVMETVALLHLGRKSTNLRLAEKVVGELVRSYGTDPHHLEVTIGPGIHKESYVFESPEQKTLPEWSNFLTDLPDGTTQIDLVGYNLQQFVDAGIAVEQIRISDVDTAASPEYFSHYRSTRTGEPEGRFATVIGLAS